VSRAFCFFGCVLFYQQRYPPLASKRKLFSFHLIAPTPKVGYSVAWPRRELKIVEIYVLFFVATIVAGAINALAGGGGLITFTLLILVVPPVTADATSAVALLLSYPTAVWRTRDELSGTIRQRWLWLLLIPSLLGGLLGALLLSWTGNRNLVILVPWLVLITTLLILLRPILVRQRDHGDRGQPGFPPKLWAVAVVATFVIALYGGYFGAGIGILMIGALSLMGFGDIRHVVALKNLLAGCLRSVAVVVLVVEGTVNWGYGVPMALGSLVGGYLGGLVSHRANRAVVRWIVIGIGFGVAAYYFWRLYGLPVLHVGGE
jgi:uncharacterized membrane protein YfcA